MSFVGFCHKMQSEILAAVVGIILFEVFKFILTTKFQIKLKMKCDPWIVVQQEARPAGARWKKPPMPSFWDWHIDDLRFAAAQQGLQLKNVKKEEFIQQLVELHR